MNSPKIRMPLLTKLAIGWLVLVGIYLVVGGALSTFTQIILPSYDTKWSSVLLSALLWFGLALFVSFIPIVLICRKNWLSWEIAVILLMTGQIVALILSLAFGNVSLLIFLAALFIPFLLVILDQPKYCAMLRQRELAKNKDTIPTLEQ